MIASASCPASCGEFIQGWIHGSEKLVSCPIDWYSTVSVAVGQPAAVERPHMRQALLATLDHFGVKEQFASQLYLTLDSSVPIAKGMASSTADIAATVLATARWLNATLTAEDIADLCLEIEPTDSTLFPALTLFDHLAGQSNRPLGLAPEMDILILEPLTQLTTNDYRQKIRHATLKKSERELNEACRLLELGCLQQNPRLIGEAATISAVCNQRHLAKPHFSQLLSLVEQLNLYGITVAHSGTVVGLLFDSQRNEPQQLRAMLMEQNVQASYPQMHLTRVISGGLH